MTRTELDDYLLAGSRSLVVMALTTTTVDPTTHVATTTVPDDAAISAWLDYPIGDALAAIGYPAAAFSGVVDGDLAAVPATLAEKLKIVALWKMKLQLADRLNLCDMTRGTDSQKLSQLAAGLEASLARLERRLMVLYPALFAGTLTAGRIRLASTARRANAASEMG